MFGNKNVFKIEIKKTNNRNNVTLNEIFYYLYHILKPISHKVDNFAADFLVQIIFLG